jgi:1,4-dihydroxy-2-naphthoate octaprenyltransferase
MMEAEVLTGSGPAHPGLGAIWFQAIRSYSLTASATPVLVGTAMAVRAGFFSTGRFVLALVGALAIQIGTNLINDYYDYASGADSPDSMGGSRVIQQDLLTPGEVWWGGIVAFVIGAVFGLALVYLCGWPILLLGIPSVAAGYFYTASPVSLAYVALGEATVFVFMGPVIVVGAYYVMALSFSWPALIASLPIGCMVAAILHVNNIRDIESDRVYQKRTLANLLSRRVANLELLALDAGAYALTVVGALVGALPWTVLLTFVTMGRARDELRIVFNEDDPKKLNVALLRSAQLHLEFGIVLFVAILLGWVLGW